MKPALGLRALLFTAASLPWAGPWLPGTARRALGLAFAPICHQRPERTLVLAGHAMSVCSRCAGLYAGVALGALVAWPRLGSTRYRSVFAIAAALLLMDVVAQDSGLHPVWHLSRLLTGAACGYVASAWLSHESACIRSGVDAVDAAAASTRDG